MWWLTLLGLIGYVWSWNVEDFGAKAGIETWEVAQWNAKAYLKTLSAANASSTDRSVVFPEGKMFFMYAANISFISNVEIRIDGTLKYTDEVRRWPKDNYAFMYFTYCEGIHLTGKGMIDGQGLNWWRLAYTGTDNRPDMINFKYSRDLTVTNLYLYSSPKYSINFGDCADVIVHDVTIYVNSSLVRGRDEHPSVTYALNTDGIDIAATNVKIYNNNITNYDDGIVAKPCKSTGKYCQCSGNMEIYNNTIFYSTGLTIGSVPPNANINCVRNVTFRNNTMHRPLKAIYIKSNPGTTGTGIIENIVYEDILIDHALWWTIWIGPQQQNQPGTQDTKTGCNFLFPFIPVCPTQPLVSIRNIVLRNVRAVETIPLFQGPGVILCDASNPCTDFVFENVTNSVFTGTMEEIYEQLPVFYIPGVIFPTPHRSDDWEFEYVTAHLSGTLQGEVDPTPCMQEDCFWAK